METKHLIIRDTEFDDCRYFAKWEQSPEVTEFFSIDEERDYEEITREFITRQLVFDKLQLTIVLKESGEPIGRIYISKISREEDSCDITRIYVADPAMRGRGFGEEALRAVLDFCFINLHMERVTIDHFTGNTIASVFYTKLGFSYEGIARNAAKKDGKYYDLHQMSMLRQEYYEKLHVK